MASLGKIIHDDRHPIWLIDAIILSAAVYGKDPQEELDAMDKDYGLPATAKYEFLSEEELQAAGFADCKQTLIVVRSLTGGHYIVACRGTMDVSDALVDLNIVHRTVSLGEGAAHAGFLDRAKSIPLDYFRRLLVRNERVVLAGHSLGGAVASLLTLRLLEATGRWCHEQVQCYTFGSPFFADYQLAKYINMRYKRHFVHLVSRNDFVPKVMPVAYTLYSLWAGLQVGPLEDVFHCTRVCMLVLEMMKMRLKITEKARLLAMASQGQMMLLDPETSAFELANREQWTLNTHLSFHLGGVSLDVVKEHSLLSYIEHIFTVQAAEVSASMGGAKGLKDPISSSSNVKVHMATVNFKVQTKGQASATKKQVKQTCMSVGVAENEPANFMVAANAKKKKRAIRALKSQVACVIFARRLQEASPKSLRKKRRKKHEGFVKFVMFHISRLSRFIQRFDKLFLASSVICAGVQIHKYFHQSR
ncbi:hypothetical protein GOP47_0023874 [Adiantum capillus-veneris]|uniref:Fungal lipase-type domain-containing protein n=1 Tax=Adiantum capillus-veneris TaxID=13818 RepID=A0A9D4U4B7_ADICA|nr:hypothetical protein GOP47_0023874 [Adiantum capillus-veneris]